jgi:transposase-like protein
VVGVRFNPEDRVRLLQNENVLRVSDKTLTYSPDFKVRAVRESVVEGKPPHLIFLDAGFDLDLIGHDTPKHRLKKWRKVFAQRGEQGLRDDRRGKHTGVRLEAKDLTVEEKLRRAEARVRYLEKENEFLKKLDALERAWLADRQRSTR